MIWTRPLGISYNLCLNFWYIQIILLLHPERQWCCAGCFCVTFQRICVSKFFLSRSQVPAPVFRFLWIGCRIKKKKKDFESTDGRGGEAGHRKWSEKCPIQVCMINAGQVAVLKWRGILISKNTCQSWDHKLCKKSTRPCQSNNSI